MGIINISMKRGIYLLVISLIFVLIIISFASANIFDWFKKITGQATSQPTNVSITLTGVNPVVVRVWNETLTGALVTPSPAAALVLYFNVTVTDVDGINDINTTSVAGNATANVTGETMRVVPGNCTVNSGESTTNSSNFTCNVTMWHWDANTTWNITISATDLGNKTFINSTNRTFDYSSLSAIVIDPTMITFPALSPGDINKTSLLNTTINNTGNYIIIANNVSVNATNLRGMTDITQFFNVGNFSVSWNSTTTGMGGACNNATTGTGTRLDNNVSTGIAGANLTKGNLSKADGTAQEILYYCAVTVPSLPSQIYATNTSGAWVVRVV